MTATESNGHYRQHLIVKIQKDSQHKQQRQKQPLETLSEDRYLIPYLFHSSYNIHLVLHSDQGASVAWAAPKHGKDFHSLQQSWICCAAFIDKAGQNKSLPTPDQQVVVARARNQWKKNWKVMAKVPVGSSNQPSALGPHSESEGC